ncbi:MAG: HD domain-containing protein, partial [Patescibacteria group bacterium]|nr:HD domain-containing protein [Patescibacteria group bacterium]
YMIENNIKQKIRDEAKSLFKNASGCHDWTHVERVTKLALRIGRKESADLDILEVASFLHDIGRKEEMKNKGNFCHAEEGAMLAEKILKMYKIDKDIIDNISHCIISHRYRNSHIPETIEAKVLYDADKLDSIGAVGVARDFLFAGNAGSNCLYTGNEKRLAKEEKDYSYSKEYSAILEYEIKLKKVKDKIITKTGKSIAKERHLFMRDYFKRFWKEVNGEL